MLAQFGSGDLRFLADLLDAWAHALPIASKCRWDYRVVWRDAEFGEMRFHALVTTASEPDGLAFNDWHPVDAETWRVLDLVKARHAGRDGAG